jgi:hypothetical protein
MGTSVAIGGRQKVWWLRL